MENKELTTEQEQVARFAKALSHPIRVAILQMLASQECCYHGDMSEVLPIAKSTLSQHLNELKDAGLIQGTISLPTVKYCINKENWIRARQLFSSMFIDVDRQEACMTNEAKKELVKQRYSQLALNSDELKGKCCCGTNPAHPTKKIYTIMSEDYSRLKGYEADADLGVGCGLPTQFAAIKAGDIVLDLGSGAGNDCFIARSETGETGKVIGVDFSPQMIAKARRNAIKRGFTNIEFIEGDIEDIPLPDNSVDVVVSNCVLNLLPEKNKVFKEIYRVLKKGGHFCISDVVLNGVFPKEFTDNASMYAGCIASAIQREDYLGEIVKANFNDIKVERTKTVIIPDEVLEENLDEATIAKYKVGNVGIYSITVTGIK